MNTYAGKIEDGYVTQAIVGTAEWAIDNLGGEWVDSLDKIGIGWTWDADNGFRPESPYLSWIWDGSKWQPPVPYPDDGNDYMWDEEAVMWFLLEPPVE
jgi:hypothetical protein